MKKYLLIVGVLSLGIMSFTTYKTVTTTKSMVLQDEILIEGVGISRTIEATGKENIRIEGTNNKITITGACNSIKIEGVDNIVKVDDVKTVTVEGTGNKVSYKKSSATDGKVKTTVSGVNNKIDKI